MLRFLKELMLARPLPIRSDEQAPLDRLEERSRPVYTYPVQPSYVSLSTDQLVELFCSGALTEPTLSAVIDELKKRGVLTEPIGSTTQEASEAAQAHPPRLWEVGDSQDWRSVEAAYVGLDPAVIEAAMAAPPRPFPELSGEEYIEVCAGGQARGRFQDLTQGEIFDLLAQSWKFNPARWPGPDRARWKIDRDIVSPSPDGQFACVLYSCAEIGMNLEVGLLAVLHGPPESPKVILRPSDFTCWCGAGSIQWLEGGRYCVVISFLYNQATNKVELFAFTFLDLLERTFAYQEIPDASFVGQPFVEAGGRWVIRSAVNTSGNDQEMVFDRKQLAWQGWKYLTGKLGSPDRRLPKDRLFVETPWGKAYQS